MQQSLQFILVPDSSAARRLRRILATQSPRHGTLIGTWPELVAQANNAYLVPPCTEDLQQKFITALSSIPNAYWSKSFEVAPDETAVEVEESFLQIVSATNPEGPIIIGDSEQLAERPRKHLKDIVHLVAELGENLPEQLNSLKRILNTDSKNTIKRISVCYLDNYPSLTRWQRALIDKLNADSVVPPSSELCSMLQMMINGLECASNSSALHALQNNLFSLKKDNNNQSLDSSLQWLGVRDYCEEAEIAAGMVQCMLDEHETLKASEIGLLVPDSFEYSLAINDSFSLAGLPLSGLPTDKWKRDLGREVLFHFLYCRQKPAPVMALADCLSSPLMPWSQEQGALLAQSVMNGNYRLKPFSSATANDKKMLNLLSDGDDSVQALDVALKSFVLLLDGDVNHVERAKSIVSRLSESLASSVTIDWKALRRLTTPRNISTAKSPEFNVDGVTIFRESHEPWRAVRFLIVFDFAAGHYPERGTESSVFVSDDLDAIGNYLNLPVSTQSNRMAERRARFKRQLAAASDFVSFMVPRRSINGSKQSPSESLVFMQQLFLDIANADTLILELDIENELNSTRFVPTIDGAEPPPLRKIVVQDLDLEMDLLSLQKDEQGNPKPESPSSLETLMVSRLAWLLRKMKAEPLGWGPERLDVLILGTLAHAVFEELFLPGKSIPDAHSINSQIDELLELAIKQNAPFLLSAQWDVERSHMAVGIATAALAWGDVLSTLNAEILGREEWLKGSLEGVPIHGQVDLLLGLPSGRLLVVDYKRASSASRRPRMTKGYDSQASLYRTMLKTGGTKSQQMNKALDRFRQLDTMGIVYFMMNDQTSLSDALLVESAAIPGWEVLGGDVSSGAIELIKERLDEVRHGQLYLNRTDDSQFFEKETGIKPYALQNSPLIALFTIAGDSREAK